MPYKIEKRGSSYVVVSASGRTWRHTSKRKAQAQIRLLRMVEHGGKVRKR